MKKFLPLLLLFISCKDEPKFEVEGQWTLERLEAYEDYYLPALTFTTDTVFEGVEFYFDSLDVYTMVDDTINYVPIIGYHYETKWVHTYEWQDTSLWIGVEEWKVIQSDDNHMVIENLTVYGIVGESIRTLYFSRN